MQRLIELAGYKMTGAVEEVEPVLGTEQSPVGTFHRKLGFEEQGLIDIGLWVRMNP